MTYSKIAATAICAGISLFASLPLHAGAAAEVSSPQRNGALPGGGTYVVHRDATVGNAVVELWFRAPGAGYDSAAPGLSRLALTAVAASRPAPHDTSFAEAVRLAGGRLSINAYPDIVEVGASVPAASAAAIVRAMTRAYFRATIGADGFKSAQRDVALAAAEKHFSADRTVHDLLMTQLFTGGPAHYPPTPDSVASLGRLTLAQTQAFAQRAFREANAVLSIAGNAGPAAVAAAWHPAGAASGAPVSDPPFDSTPARDLGDAVAAAPIAGAGLAWLGPGIAKTRAATALDFVADYLFNADNGVVTAAADSIDPDSVVNGQFITLHEPGVLLVTISSQKQAGALRAETLAAVDRLRSPLDARAFAAARKAFEYHILSAVQTPVNAADNFGWFAVEGDAAYAPGDVSGTYVRDVESLDPRFVASVVRAYLAHPATVELTQSHSQEASQ
ncbi:MAG TPA: hypothetical protein VIG32_08665 [Candidatus Baltobacteraceae bacterium]